MHMVDTSAGRCGGRASHRGLAGRAAITVMLTLGVAGAAGCYWYYAWSQRRPLSWLGPAAGELILRAPQVELLRYGGTDASIAWRRDVTAAPGLINLRHGLLLDGTYEWNGEPQTPPPAAWGLRFFADNTSATIVFPEDAGRAWIQDSDKSQVLRAEAAMEFHDFFEAQSDARDVE